MKVLLDLNVLLDVVQNRAPHYEDSAKVLSLARLGEVQAVLPVHAFTTLYYILAKAAGKPKAEQTVDWLLSHFEVAVADTQGSSGLGRAMESRWDSGSRGGTQN